LPSATQLGLLAYNTAWTARQNKVNGLSSSLSSLVLKILFESTGLHGSSKELSDPSIPIGISEAHAERALVEKVLSGDRKAAAEFIQRYSDTVYRFLRRRVDQQDIIDDLFQDTFISAWQNLGQFRGDSTLPGWLCGVARNKLADYYRAKVSVAISDDDGPETLPAIFVTRESNLEERLDEDRLARTIQSVMQGMPQSYSAVLRWRYWDSHSLAEIAEMSGRTTKAVERLLARARAEFARRWNRE